MRQTWLMWARGKCSAQPVLQHAKPGGNITRKISSDFTLSFRIPNYLTLFGVLRFFLVQFNRFPLILLEATESSSRLAIGGCAGFARFEPGNFPVALMPLSYFPIFVVGGGWPDAVDLDIPLSYNFIHIPEQLGRIFFLSLVCIYWIRCSSL